MCSTERNGGRKSVAQEERGAAVVWGPGPGAHSPRSSRRPSCRPGASRAAALRTSGAPCRRRGAPPCDSAHTRRERHRANRGGGEGLMGLQGCFDEWRAVAAAPQPARCWRARTRLASRCPGSCGRAWTCPRRSRRRRRRCLRRARSEEFEEADGEGGAGNGAISHVGAPRSAAEAANALPPFRTGGRQLEVEPVDQEAVAEPLRRRARGLEVRRPAQRRGAIAAGSEQRREGGRRRPSAP